MLRADRRAGHFDDGTVMTRELTLEPEDPAAELPMERARSAMEPARSAMERARSAGDRARPDLRLASTQPQVDLAGAERAAADFLGALGIPLDSESMRDTPARMARAYAELLQAEPLRLTTFPNDAGYDELVLARDIPFRTVCEHHLLPFAGVAHVGYVPGERILGLSKLARVVEHYAARPQVQERLTRQVADCLAARLRPRAVGVVLEAEHTCMTLRGVRSRGSVTVTSAFAGELRDDPSGRAEFLALAGTPEGAD
jgi:GTP cyclohydrolase IA